jgi:hypothetical protein
VVVWKWGKKYTADHVTRMRSMLARHLHLQHRLVCITDQPNELPDGVEAFTLPPAFPYSTQKCMRRLWMYSPKAKRLGDRLFQLDLDMVITDDITPLVDRPDPFVIWKSDSNVVHGWGYNPSAMLMTPGAKAHVWHDYLADPKGVCQKAEAAGWWVKVNSDQAIMSYLLANEDVPTWTVEDGIHAYRVCAGKHGQRGKFLPDGARIVSFHGPRDPSTPELHAMSPWLTEHWR